MILDANRFIADVMKAQPERRFDSKAVEGQLIAAFHEYIKVKKNSARTILHTLYHKGEIERVSRGMYRWKT